MLSSKELLDYDMSLFDVYLKLLLIKLRTEIGSAEISKSNLEESGNSDDEEEKVELGPEEKDRLDLINKGLSNSKYCFLYKVKDKTFLVSKVHIQGVVVYKDSKENRVILGCNTI